MQRIEKFERYQSELQERLEHYATVLQNNRADNYSRCSKTDHPLSHCIMQPACPSMLCDDPWSTIGPPARPTWL